MEDSSATETILLVSLRQKERFIGCCQNAHGDVKIFCFSQNILSLLRHMNSTETSLLQATYFLFWSHYPEPRPAQYKSAARSLHAQTLGSWLRILLEVWLSVRVCIVFVLSCEGSNLAIGLISRPRRHIKCL